MIQEKWLMMRFNRGDSQALRDIYVRYKDDLVSLADALLHDKTSAEDAVHDVFAMLIARQDTLKITANLRQYLLTAVANSARRHYRVQKKTPEVSLDAENAPDIETENPPESSAIFGEQQRHLADALAVLPYDQREVILLRHFSDLKFKAIASARNVSINTVQGRYRYGLDKLRSLLNGELL
ncbi:MAG: RNA polymerase sigma factor [Planctomycetes bacterium]|nr:RNA polymerase sigma factor [Planctomycetota bacterium]